MEVAVTAAAMAAVAAMRVRGWMREDSDIVVRAKIVGCEVDWREAGV